MKIAVSFFIYYKYSFFCACKKKEDKFLRLRYYCSVVGEKSEFNSSSFQQIFQIFIR